MLAINCYCNCKKPRNYIHVCNCISDPSVDRMKTCAVPILKKFLSGDNEVIFTISKRGAAPLGGGEIKFKCPPSRNLRSIQVSRKYIYIYMYIYISFIKVFIS